MWFMQTQFAEHQSQRMTDFQKLQSQFESFISGSNDTFASSLDDFDDRFKTRMKELSEQIDTFIQSEKDKVQALFDHLEERKKQVDELAGAVSVTSLSGHYKKTAERELETENLWKWITTGLFVLLLATSIYTYFSTPTEFSWKSLIPKLLVTISLVSFIGFSYRQVAVHRSYERYNRQFHLELASLEPFMATLEPAVATEIKKQLSEKLFGRAESTLGVASKEDKGSLISVEDLNKMLGEIAKIAKKKSISLFNEYYTIRLLR